MIRHERRGSMRLLARLLEPRATAHAHCDLPCGVYDPAQARIEAESVKAIIQKYHDNDDPAFRTRALLIKEQRSELVKHHLWVLWTDYFKPPHFEKYPQLNQLFNEATTLDGGGVGGGVARQDGRDQQELLGDEAGLRPPGSAITHAQGPAGAGLRGPAHFHRRLRLRRRSDAIFETRTRGVASAWRAVGGKLHGKADDGREPRSEERRGRE